MSKTHLRVFLYLLVSRETKQKLKKMLKLDKLRMNTSYSRLNNNLIIINPLIYQPYLYKSSALLILSHHLCDSPVSILGLSRISVSKLRNHRQTMFVKRRIFFQFYRTLPNQLDGISPLTVYLNTFQNVLFVIFLVFNSRLTRMALQMLKKPHDVF